MKTFRLFQTKKCSSWCSSTWSKMLWNSTNQASGTFWSPWRLENRRSSSTRDQTNRFSSFRLRSSIREMKGLSKRGKSYFLSLCRRLKTVLEQKNPKMTILGLGWRAAKLCAWKWTEISSSLKVKKVSRFFPLSSLLPLNMLARIQNPLKKSHSSSKTGTGKPPNQNYLAMSELSHPISPNT